MKNVVILGSTGSIGINTLQVINNLPDKYNVVGLSAHKNINLLIQQICKYKPRVVAIMDEKVAKELKNKIVNLRVRVLSGVEGLQELASLPGVDLVVCAVVGAIGLLPLLSAIESGKTIALANKESLVIAGDIVMNKAKKFKATILPLDSEHSAIFQCMKSDPQKTIKKIILTASGGPFRQLAKKHFKKVTVEQTLSHPSWRMGKKITVDSATLMNKGLETIEAHYLFGVPIKDINILVHPQSIVHSMVEFSDGSVLAQMSVPDMRLPIQYALTYPERVDTGLPRLDLLKVKKLDFYPVELHKFPCLRIALESANKGGTYPVVLNAANEVAVNAFLNHRISFIEISKVIEKVVKKHKNISRPSLKTILETDFWARNETERLVLC